MKSRFTLPAFLAIVGLSILAATSASCGKSLEPATTPEPLSARAEIITVQVEETPDQYVATGSVHALYNATLSSKVMGRVVNVTAREGDVIKRGQVLVALDPRELQASVNMAQANYQSNLVGVDNAKTAAAMEARTSDARIAAAIAQVNQAQAGLASAKAKRDLVVAGPRPQEVDQAHLGVVQAQSNLDLAKTDLDRASTLVEQGALAQRELDLAKNKFDVAKGQYDIAVKAENIAREGSRTQDIRAAQQAVAEAEAALEQAKVGVTEARAAALQAKVRLGDIQSAKAQVAQSSAAVQSAQVALSYSSVVAPFDGRVVQRTVDPGAMAAPGVPLIAIEGGEYRLEASVPEEVMSSIFIGKDVPVQIDALSGKTINSRVAEINPRANGTTHTFVVKLRLASDSNVRSGMFGRALIPVGASKQILIPTAATWQREGLNYVYIVNKDGIARLRIITLGHPRGDRVEVLSGLNAGERIVASEPDNVTDGAKVEGA